MRFILCLLLAIPGISLAKNDIAKKHQDIFAKVEHISVSFEQIIYKKLRDRTMKRKGKAYFSKPNYFRWNFNNKNFGNEEFYYNGKTLTHFREKEALVTNYNANIGLARELNEVVNLVLDPRTLYIRYDTSNFKQIKGTSSMTLTPRAGIATEIAEIDIKVSDQRKYVKNIKIVYLDGNYTHFKFKNPRFSVNKPELFIFSKKGKYTIRNHG